MLLQPEVKDGTVRPANEYIYFFFYKCFTKTVYQRRTGRKEGEGRAASTIGGRNACAGGRRTTPQHVPRAVCYATCVDVGVRWRRAAAAASTWSWDERHSPSVEDLARGGGTGRERRVHGGDGVGEDDGEGDR